MRQTVHSYRDLLVWQRGIDLAEASYILCRKLPRDERFGLIAQIRRASTSIPANVAEGHGREHLGDYLRFLSIANGSLMELETHIFLAERLRYVASQDTAKLFEKSAELGRMLAGLTAALKERLRRRRSDLAPDT